MTFIQTVLGRIPPEALGVTYSHDHLLFQPPPEIAEQDPDLALDSVEAAIQELKTFKMAGGQALVEMTTIELGRDPKALHTISKETGIHIIAATGYNKGKFCEGVVAEKSAADIAAEMIQDLLSGMDGTDCMAGLIKASSSKDGMTSGESKVFEAAIQAHHQTGAPISTHTEAGTYAIEQAEMLLAGGVPPKKIIIGHLDRKLDWDYHQQIADMGVYLGFDQISKEKYFADADRIRFIQRLIQHSHGHQILLSGDWARKSYWPSYGFGNGPGLTYILWRFVPWMLQEGVEREAVQAMLVSNPAQAFAWSPH
jgi:predicted metal-dependent phosphotriesterase family hydrolase